jgi:translation initiation factor 1
MGSMGGRTTAGQGGLVYSTEAGRMCPACRQPLARCACKAAAPAPAGDGNVRVARETGGRGGKAVTVVRGLPLAGDDLAALAKRLRTACGAGGTVRDGVIEIQGEQRDRVVALLLAEGFRAKTAGG